MYIFVDKKNLSESATLVDFGYQSFNSIIRVVHLFPSGHLQQVSLQASLSLLLLLSVLFLCDIRNSNWVQFFCRGSTRKKSSLVVLPSTIVLTNKFPYFSVPKTFKNYSYCIFHYRILSW